MMRLLKLMMLYGLMMAAAGCAIVPERPPVDPQLVRGNILRLANAEWNAFGNQTIYRDGGRERIDPVGVWEDERRGSPRIAQYWNAGTCGIPGDPGAPTNEISCAMFTSLRRGEPRDRRP